MLRRHMDQQTGGNRIGYLLDSEKRWTEASRLRSFVAQIHFLSRLLLLPWFLPRYAFGTTSNNIFVTDSVIDALRLSLHMVRDRRCP